MNQVQTLSLIILAIGVLLSYYIVFGRLYDSSGYSYYNHPFWFGLKESFVKIIVFFQVLALIGFVVSNTYWYNEPPVGGIMSYNNMLFYTLAAFFICSIIWPFAVYYKQRFISVISLVIVAIASILLLAGSIEESNNRLYVILGFFFLCIITVLGDAVVWNSNYISKN
jgi:hypothetical protein